jgi:dTDP-4-dehydrorhamnose 3,5-epimerase
MFDLVPAGAADAWLIRCKVHRDDRGDFTRTWSFDEFHEAGLSFTPIQANTSTTRLRGTIRGMHFQHAPRQETKLVRCARGLIFDVITDLRPASPTYRQSRNFELGKDTAQLYVPAGFAHGYQTLTDDVVVEYLMNESYAPDLADGFRYDDPAAAIIWPLPSEVVSDRDRAWPRLDGREFWTRPRDLAGET